MPDFETVYRQHFRFVWNSARRLGIGIDAIDDVVQEVFIVIHRKIHAVENPDALRAWIYGIVRRTASSHRRKVRPGHLSTSGQPELEYLLEDARTPFDDAQKKADLQLLSRILSEMKEIKREIFTLVEIEEMQVNEAAAALDIPVNTAHSRLRLAREDFQKALEQWESSKGEDGNR